MRTSSPLINCQLAILAVDLGHLISYAMAALFHPEALVHLAFGKIQMNYLHHAAMKTLLFLILIAHSAAASLSELF